MVKLLIAVVFSALLLVPVGSQNALAGSLFDLGDFKCYRLDSPILTDLIVTLDDQFHLEENVDVTSLEWLCTFAQKSAGVDFPASPLLNDIELPNQHFLVYRIDEPTPGFTVDLTDQFSPPTETHLADRAVQLWVPADKTTFQCPFSLGGLQTPFDFNFGTGLCERTVTTGTGCPAGAPPVYTENPPGLCTGPPTVINSFPNFNTEFGFDIHYKCYEIDPIPFSKTNPVILNTQFFNSQDDDLGNSELLCNPVRKQVISAPSGQQPFTGTKDSDHLKCYTISNPEFPIGPLPNVHFSMTDQFDAYDFEPLRMTEERFCTLVDKELVSTDNGGAIGGEIIPIETTGLLLAGAQTNAVWIMSALAVIGSVAFGALYITSRKHENS